MVSPTRPFASRRVLLADCRVLDPRDGALAEPRDLLIEDRRIATIAAAGAIPRHGTTVIEGRGGVALPGLIDCHAHVAGIYLTEPPRFADLPAIPRQILANLRSFVTSGVTTVRDMAGPWRLTHWLRRLAEEHRIVAPRLLVPGPIFTAPRGYPRYLDPLPAPLAMTLGQVRVDVADVASAHRWVDRLAAHRVDLVKVAYTTRDYDDARTPIPVLGDELMRAIAERAHHHNLPVAVHHIFADDLPGLLRLPFDTLEHLSIDREIEPALIAEIARRRLPVTTTLMTYGIIDFLDRLIPLTHDRRRFTPRSGAAVRRMADEITSRRFGIPSIGRRVIETGMTHMRVNLRRLVDAGIRIGAGTDAGGALTPCGEIAWELESLVGAGFTPLDAVRAATCEAAVVIGRPDLGVLEPGRPADLVLCRDNPARDLSALRAIELVIRDGAIVHRGPPGGPGAGR